MAGRPAKLPVEGRYAERSLVLTVVAFVLLTPPIIGIFDAPYSVFGVPILHIYSFTVWLVAIVLGSILARRLSAQPTPVAPDESAASGDDDGGH